MFIMYIQYLSFAKNISGSAILLFMIFTLMSDNRLPKALYALIDLL